MYFESLATDIKGAFKKINIMKHDSTIAAHALKAFVDNRTYFDDSVHKLSTYLNSHEAKDFQFKFYYQSALHKNFKSKVPNLVQAGIVEINFTHLPKDIDYPQIIPQKPTILFQLINQWLSNEIKTDIAWLLTQRRASGMHS